MKRLIDRTPIAQIATGTEGATRQRPRARRIVARTTEFGGIYRPCVDSTSGTLAPLGQGALP